MEVLNKIIIVLSLVTFVAGCGVKGKPLPPLEPPSIGTGTPESLKKDDKKNEQKR